MASQWNKGYTTHIAKKIKTHHPGGQHWDYYTGILFLISIGSPTWDVKQFRYSRILCASLRSTLIYVMVWRLIGTKPLSEPMMAYCKLDPWEQISVDRNTNIFIQGKGFEMPFAKLQSFCLDPNVLKWQGTRTIVPVHGARRHDTFRYENVMSFWWNFIHWLHLIWFL